MTRAVALLLLFPALAWGESGTIDVHAHLQTGKGGRRGYDSAAAALLEQMDRAGVEKAVLMSPPRTVKNSDKKEFGELARLAHAHPDRFLLAGGGSMLNPMIHAHAPEEVTDAVRAEFVSRADRIAGAGLAAFGEMAALHLSFNSRHPVEHSSPDHPLFLLLADLAAEKGIPIDLHTEAVTEPTPLPAGFHDGNPAVLEPTVPGLERLLAHNRGASIVWQHIGWDNTGQMTPGLLRRLLGDHPNLFLALRVEDRPRAMDGSPMPHRLVDGEGQIRPEWLELFLEFPDRFVIGSDEFFRAEGVTRRAGPTSFRSTWAFLPQLPPELARKIGGENAARIYRVRSPAR